MKLKYALGLLTLGMSASAMSQEIDDMYFNSKDRSVVIVANQVALNKRYQQEDMAAVKNRPVNPSDSYSGRGVNPEYNSQAKNGTTLVQDNPDYFVSNYQPKSVNKNLYSGANSYNNCNCGYSNPNYGMGGYGGYGSPYYSPYGSMYSPYSMYGSMYSPYSMYGGMYSPYSMYGSMYSPYSMYGGMYSPYSSGMSMMMGYGSGFGGYSALGYGMSYMFGSYGMSGYPASYTSVNYDTRARVDGRHPSRSSSLNNYVDNTRTLDGTNQAIAGTNGRVRDGGRVSTSGSQYYDRSWRNNSDNFTRSGWSNPGANTGTSSWNGGNTSSGWDNGSRGRYSNDAFGSGGSGGTRSSFGGGSFGGSSGGGGSVGGGGGGHSRGR